MKHKVNLYAFIAVIVSSLALANAQTGSQSTKHYEGAGVAFDHPNGWLVADRASSGVHIVTLSRKVSGSKIEVRIQSGVADISPVRRGVTTVIGRDEPPATTTPYCDFETQRKKISDNLIQELAASINAEGPGRTALITTEIGGSKVEGVQVQGVVNHKPMTGAVFSTRLNHQFVSLISTFPTNDKQAQLAWDTVRSTVKVKIGVMTVVGTKNADSSEGAISGGVLNGKAISLPRPGYPAIARSAHASGKVVVQVTIDEEGNVIAANAVEGHPLLQPECVAAASQAKFSPTKLCGEPVRVTGVITYNFVTQ